MDSKSLPYNLPKAGISENYNFNNQLLHNPFVYRIKNETKWTPLDHSTLIKNGTLIEISVSSFDYTKTSYPVEILWENENDESRGVVNLHSLILFCIISVFY